MASRPPIPPVVLVVDDDRDVLCSMARTLVGAGYAVHLASDGPDALAIAEALPMPPDLVVTDLRLETIRGAELAQRLFSRGLASRFLFVSRHGRAPEYDDQFGPLLPKPFTPEQLIAAVEGVLA